MIETMNMNDASPYRLRCYQLIVLCLAMIYILYVVVLMDIF